MKADVLRKSILQMAIQGKLVTQDSSDEPASVLLQKIRAQKEKLTQEGKIKKDKNNSVIYKGEDGKFYEKIGKDVKDITDQLPFEIPDSWAWIRLYHVLNIARGGSPRPIQDYLTDSSDGYNWIKIGDTEKGGKYINSAKEKINAAGLHKTRLVHKGDFLLTNSMSFGRPYILNIDGCIHDGWLVLSNNYMAYDVNFLYYLLSSAFAYNQFCGSVSGAVVKNLNSDKVSFALFPIPPYEEQRRIVEAIEKFEPFIAEYEKLEQQAEKLDGEIFDKLKKSILQYAIQGKLVPQDSSDEPASVLLEKIKAEKETLIKQGKIKKEKPLPPITDAEKPFDIPDTWQWVRVGDITRSYIGLTYKPSNIVTSGGNIVLRSCNIKDGKLDLSDIVRVNIDLPEKLKVNKYDIVICARNGSKKLVGKSAIVNVDLPNLTFGAFMAICKTSMYQYVAKFLQSNCFFEQLAKVCGTTTINQLTQNNFNAFLVSLPPLNEQKRIVARIEELFAEIVKIQMNK